MKTTLIYHYGGLGDFLCTLPFIYLWKERTKSRIILLGKPEQSLLVSGSGLIEETLDVENSRFLPLFTDSVIDHQQYLNSFDYIVLFSSEQSPLLLNVRKWYRGTIIHQPPIPFSGQNVIDYHLSLLHVSKTDKRMIFDSIIRIPPVYIEKCLHLLHSDKNYVTIHPGSGSSRKNWALNNFRETAVFLKSKGYNVVWILGPAEENNLEENELIINSTDILLTATVLKMSSLHLDNDSGIAHLASAVNCQSIVLFGSSNPQIWKPFYSETVVSKSNCPYLPCHPGPIRKCKHECMESISVSTVIKKIKKMIS